MPCREGGTSTTFTSIATDIGRDRTSFLEADLGHRLARESGLWLERVKAWSLEVVVTNSCLGQQHVPQILA